MKCNFRDIMFLNLNHFEHELLNYFNFIAPFGNEINRILDLEYIKKHFPNYQINNIDNFKNTFFNLITLIGIVSNTSFYGQKNYKFGLIKGILLIIFTYLFPKMFMDKILKYAKTKNKKIFLRFLVIYLLELIIISLYCLITHYFFRIK